MLQNNAPILIIAASSQVSEHQSTDSAAQASKQNQPTSQKNGYSNKLNFNRVRKAKQNDKSGPGRRIEMANPYNNVSRLSLEKKLQDESGLDVISNTSRSIFSTESPRDTKTIQSLKQKSYYLGSLKSSDPKEESRTSKNNPNSSYVGGSVYPSITLDESNTNIHRNEGSLLLENKSKNVSKAQSLNFIQSKRVSSIGTKFYHGFKNSSTIQNLTEQVESFEMPRIVSPQQNDLKPQVSGKIDSEKQPEEPVHVPRPPSKGVLNKTRSLGSQVLDHRRPKKAAIEAYSTVVKTRINLDTQAYNSVPIGTAPQSMTNLPSQDSTLDNERCETEPDSLSKPKMLRPNAERRALNRTSLNSKASKENDVSSQADLSNGQNFNHNVKIPLKPVSSNINNVERPVKRVLNSKASNSEVKGSSKEDLMKRFNEIVSYQTQPAQTGNSQVLQENNKNQGRPVTSIKDKENSMRRSVKQKQDENKPVGSGVQTGMKPADVSTNSIDAKIMLLKNKIKDKEYKRKTRKNQCLEEGEGEPNPLKTKLAEHLDNRGEMEEEMKKRLLVMRKIQLYDILIKQKMGKKLPKEALRLVKAEFDKVNLELEELKLHEQ